MKADVTGLCVSRANIMRVATKKVNTDSKAHTASVLFVTLLVVRRTALERHNVRYQVVTKALMISPGVSNSSFKDGSFSKYEVRIKKKIHRSTKETILSSVCQLGM